MFTVSPKGVYLFTLFVFINCDHPEVKVEEETNKNWTVYNRIGVKYGKRTNSDIQRHKWDVKMARTIPCNPFYLGQVSVAELTIVAPTKS